MAYQRCCSSGILWTAASSMWAMACSTGPEKVCIGMVFAALGGLDGGLRRLHDAVALERGDLNDLAAQLAGELGDVDLVAVLADHVHHVDGDDHGDAQLGELRR